MEHKNEEEKLMMKYLRILRLILGHRYLKKKWKQLDQQQNQY